MLRRAAAISLLPGLWPRLAEPQIAAQTPVRRVRPSDPSWPNAASWDELNQAVGGNLIRLQSPLADCAVAADNSSCQDVLQNLKNPYYIGDQPGLTQTSGWFDAWVSAPSAYAVAARTGRYVQGGGCATVGVAGLIQSGGFGSFSKNYGMAAAGLLEAEIVTPDGAVRIANACTNPELFWGIKGGGGGSLGVVTTLTLRTHELPSWFGAAFMTIKAASDAAYRRLTGEFIRFYRDRLLNRHWGEIVGFGRNNSLVVPGTGQAAGTRPLAAVSRLGCRASAGIHPRILADDRQHTGPQVVGR